jgi:hypothetical protein
MLPWALILSRCGASGPVLRAAAACLVAPEGVAVWAVAVPLPVWWPPRGSPSGRWRVPLPVQWPPRGSLSGRWRCPWLPLPVWWPPRGSPSGRWRCRCLPGGPRGGRRSSGGVPLPARWPPRGSPGGRWRGARVPFGGGWCSEERHGCISWRRWCSEERRWCRGLRPGACLGSAGRSEELPVGPQWAPMPPNPVRGRFAAPPRGVGSSVPWAASPRPRGGLGRRSWEGPPSLFRGSAGWVLGGCAAGGVASPKRGGVADCLGVSAPRGEWAHVGPQWRLVGRGQAPSRPVCRRASSFRRRASACIAGVIPLAGEEPSWLRRRGGAVRVRVRGAGAEAPSSRLRVRRGSAGAEAPVSPLRGPLRGLSAPPRGVGVPGAACAVFPPGPRAGWSACVAEAPRVPTRCAVVRSCPRAGPSPCFAEARLGRHVPAHRGELGPGSAEAGPGCVRGCPWTLPLKVVRRSAWPSVSPLGPKPLPGAPCPWPRPGGGRGGESSRAAAASRSSGRGSLLPRGTRQGDGFRSEAGLVSLSLKGLWSRQRTTRRLCCR